MHPCLWPLLLALGIMLAAGLRAADSPPVGADLVLLKGKIWTVNKAQAQAEVLAVWRDRIIAVGSKAEIRAHIGPRTRTIDLKGRRVVPGFYDSHIHLLGSGQRLSEVALKDAPDEAEFGRRLGNSTASCRATAGSWAANGTTIAPSPASCRRPSCSTNTSPNGRSSCAATTATWGWSTAGP